MKSFVASAAASVFVFACAADPGTRPHDMSATSHEAMAKQEDPGSERARGGIQARRARQDDLVRSRRMLDLDNKPHEGARRRRAAPARARG